MGLTALSAWAVQFELAGVGAGWTTVTADVLIGSAPLKLHYGINGSGPLDRVAGVGTCTFALDNSASNSAGTLGYYSPLNSNVRVGFTWGIGVRVSFTYGGVTYYKFSGKIKQIAPAPGLKRERVTQITCVDWMDEASNFPVRDVGAQLGKRSDELFSAVVAIIPKQPLAQSVAVGRDTYTYAFDDLGDQSFAATVFQKIAQSELGYIYSKGDTTQGGTLTFLNRHSRILAGPTNAITLDNSMTEMDVPRTLDMLFNRVETVVHPRSVDAAATTVLYAMPTGTANSIFVSSGSSYTLFADYRDPAQKLSLVGGTAMVNPVATTDYLANVAADGSGLNLTAGFTVTATFFAATAKLVIANTGADGYVTFLQVRGKGIYDYGPQRFRSDDPAGQALEGLRSVEVDMPYQDSPVNGQGVADYICSLYEDPVENVSRVKFFASHSAAFMAAALSLEPSARIGLKETVTGVTTVNTGSPVEKGFYIQWVEIEAQPSRVGPLLWCSWGLAPADVSTFWILDQVGASEIDISTVLSYA